MMKMKQNHRRRHKTLSFLYILSTCIYLRIFCQVLDDALQLFQCNLCSF